MESLTVSDILKAARLNRGWSARQLSELADLSPSYVSKVESGRINPSLEAFGRLVRLLDFNDTEIAFIVKRIAGV